MRGGEYQYPHGTYHMENVTAFHHVPGVIRV
jgi:hypothetical protein